MAQPVKFENGEVISFHILLGMWLLLRAELFHVSKSDQRCPEDARIPGVSNYGMDLSLLIHSGLSIIVK